MELLEQEFPSVSPRPVIDRAPNETVNSSPKTKEIIANAEAKEVGEVALGGVPVEVSPNPEALGELMLPPALYHTSPLDRTQSTAEHGVIPRDDQRNPGGVSGVAQMGDEYEFPGRVYLAVEPYWYGGDQVVYAVDTSMLDPSMFQVDEDNYPIGPGNHRHRPELDTPENINLALLGLPSATRDGVSGLRRTVAYQGIIPPEALIPVEVYESDEGSGSDRRIELPKMEFESKNLRRYLDAEAQRKAEENREKQRQWEATSKNMSIGDV